MLLGLLLGTGSSPLSAQSPWGMASSFSVGKVIRHTPRFPSQIADHSLRWEALAFYQTDGKHAWHARHGFPEIGIGFAYTRYDQDVLGACYSVYPSLGFTLAESQAWSWTLRLGFGLGWATQPYKRYPHWDTMNTAIGSHVNNYTLFATDLRYQINPHWALFAGGHFSHISNAAFRQPNLGINMASAHLGLRFQPKPPRSAPPNEAHPALPSRILVQARLGIAGTEIGPPDGPLYANYLVSLYASRRYASKNKLLLGVDYSYHDHIYAFLRNNEIYPGEEKAHSWKSSVFLGHEFLFGRVGVLLQLGIYLRQSGLPNPFFYQKLGGQVYLIQQESGWIKECFVSCLLKAHMADAELVEMGLGFGF